VCFLSVFRIYTLAHHSAPARPSKATCWRAVVRAFALLYDCAAREGRAAHWRAGGLSAVYAPPLCAVQRRRTIAENCYSARVVWDTRWRAVLSLRGNEYWCTTLPLNTTMNQRARQCAHARVSSTQTARQHASAVAPCTPFRALPGPSRIPTISRQPELSRSSFTQVGARR
jgi:hypothetical protein